MPDFGAQLVFASEQDLASAKDANETPRILIVEDDYLIASEMEGALGQAGFDVVGVATSAEEALELGAAKRPALAVIDIRLAGKRDGVDTAIELFAKHGIRCVFATAHYNGDTRARARPANPLAWVPKPYTMRALVETIRGVLRDLRRN
jgi:two-component system, response regulator PdtaR